MKVIGKSNFDNETVDDILIDVNLTKENAEQIANNMNEDCAENSKYYYKAVEDDYVLYRFEP